MKLQGTQTFDAPRDVVWAALLEPEVLAKTLPGITRLERAGGDRFEASMNIKVGPVQGKFDGHVALSDLDPGRGYRMALHGQGAPGFVDGHGAITLADADGGGTALGYDLDVQVGGRLAGVGQRLLETTAKSLSRQAIESLGRQVAARAAAAAGGGPVAAPEAPTVGALAAGVSRDLAAELVPPSRRPWLIVALVVAVVILILVLRAC
jgi:carbon monoxide dehydrogenase subunit G